MAILEWQDKELGHIWIKSHVRARHIILRTRADGVHVTVPPGTCEPEWRRVLEQYRAKLLQEVEKQSRKRINLEYKIEADYFRLSLETGSQDRFMARIRPGVMVIICPPTARFEDEKLQEWLRKVIEEALRKNAKSLFPIRLEELSRKHGLPYRSLKINSSKGRWGSCSARKDINLSFYLMLLPARLIDYVILHELSHTREMNHGKDFWALLNRLTGGKARALRAELRQYKTEI